MLCAALKLAGELGIVVSVPASIENPLQRHPLDANRHICEEELVKAAALAPEVNFLFHNSAAFLYAKAEKEAKLGSPDGKNLLRHLPSTSSRRIPCSSLFPTRGPTPSSSAWARRFITSTCGFKALVYGTNRHGPEPDQRHLRGESLPAVCG